MAYWLMKSEPLEMALLTSNETVPRFGMGYAITKPAIFYDRCGWESGHFSIIPTPVRRVFSV